MEYKGKLYGKVGKSLIPLEATTDDFERYKALYLEGRELLEKAKDTIEYLMERGNIASSTSKYDVRKIETFLTKHNDLT